MINANELRLGNKIYCFEAVIDITWSTLRSIQDEGNKECYNPIPLTEEWLLKFGFIKKDKYYVYHAKESNYMAIVIWMPQYNKFSYELGKGKYRVIDSVHHLQNIIHALGYQELTCTD